MQHPVAPGHARGPSHKLDGTWHTLLSCRRQQRMHGLHMNPKLKALIGQTNLSDLLPQAPQEVDLQQPVAPPEPAKPQPARSTSDALQVHFGGTDMVGKLANAPTSRRVKIFAMILLGGPTIVFGLLLLSMVWTDPAKPVFARVCGTLISAMLIGIWPYLLFRKRERSQA
jgi:hypothetical protein